MWYFALIPTYFVWHYTIAISDLKRLEKNIIWFIFNFFSIGILLDTLFSPWKRLAKDEGTKRPTYFSNLVVNVLMRLVGIFIRGATILFGTATLIVTIFAAVIVFLAWLFLPFLIPIFFLFGVSFFII